MFFIGCDEEPSDDGLHVQVFERRASILDPSPRNDLQVLDLRFGVGPPVGFDEGRDDIYAVGLERVCLLQHRVRLADSRRRAYVDAKTSAILLLQPLEQCLWAFMRRLAHHSVPRHT